MTTRTAIVFVLLAGVFATAAAAGEVPVRPRIALEFVGEPFRLLTANTSTLERDLNEAAAQGYVFAAMMGGKMRLPCRRHGAPQVPGHVPLGPSRGDRGTPHPSTGLERVVGDSEGAALLDPAHHGQLLPALTAC